MYLELWGPHTYDLFLSLCMTLRLGSKGRYGSCEGGRQNYVIHLLHTYLSTFQIHVWHYTALYKFTFYTLLYFFSK